MVAQATVDASFAVDSAWKWSLDPGGYVITSPKRGPKFRLHRLVLGLAADDPREGDHVNGDRLDNRRENLRPATRAQNGQNVPVKVGKYRGVTYDPSRKTFKCWRARVGLGGHGHHIGWYETEDEAGAAALVWIAENMPFAVLERCVRSGP